MLQKKLLETKRKTIKRRPSVPSATEWNHLPGWLK